MKKKTVLQENRTARLTILLDPNKKKTFEELCSRLDMTPSQAVRKMIREFLTKHNVTWTKTEGESDSQGQ